MVPDPVSQSLVKTVFLYKDSLSRLEEYLFSRSGRHQFLLEDIMAKRQRERTKKIKPLHVIQPNAAGIDIGATEIYVAVPDDRTDEPVRCFATFTEDLTNAVKWMKSCGIETIAMESTGVYWIPVFQILESYGFEVALVSLYLSQPAMPAKRNKPFCKQVLKSTPPNIPLLLIMPPACANFSSQFTLNTFFFSYLFASRPLKSGFGIQPL